MFAEDSDDEKEQPPAKRHAPDTAKAASSDAPQSAAASSVPDSNPVGGSSLPLSSRKRRIHSVLGICVHSARACLE